MGNLHIYYKFAYSAYFCTQRCVYLGLFVCAYKNYNRGIGNQKNIKRRFYHGCTLNSIKLVLAKHFAESGLLRRFACFGGLPIVEKTNA